jgi:tetratricopeptide (TPR) repeat protein
MSGLGLAKAMPCTTLDRYDDAIAAFEQALSINPDVPYALVGLGNVLDDSGRPEAALAAYGRAISVDPEYKFAYINRGIALTNLGRYNEAKADFQRTVDPGP